MQFLNEAVSDLSYGLIGIVGFAAFIAWLYLG